MYDEMVWGDISHSSTMYFRNLCFSLPGRLHPADVCARTKVIIPEVSGPRFS